jgi:hypothetical protein
VANPFQVLLAALAEAECQFLLIGVAGVNYYATAGSVLFVTRDRDLFLPSGPENLLRIWRVCEHQRLELTLAGEPLDMPRDSWLAQRVVERRALTHARDGRGLEVDLTLVMSGFEFDAVWSERRVFIADGVEIPVARLDHIVQSKASAGRPKDRLFLATHKEALRNLLSRDEGTNEGGGSP